MFILKLLGILFIVPIMLVIGIGRLTVKLIIKIYGTVTFWFWVLLAFCVITTIIREQWSQTAILAVLGTITFFMFVFTVWLEMTLGDINERLRGYLNHNKLS